MVLLWNKYKVLSVSACAQAPRSSNITGSRKALRISSSLNLKIPSDLLWGKSEILGFLSENKIVHFCPAYYLYFFSLKLIILKLFTSLDSGFGKTLDINMHLKFSRQKFKY